MIIPAIISASIIASASLIGIISVSRRLEHSVDRWLSVLVAFAVGVLTITTYDLLVETIEHASISLITILSIIGGFVFVQIMSMIIPLAHHHHEAQSKHHHSRIDSRRILFGDTLHNITDGLLIVPAFLSDWRSGVAVSLGIFLHEIVQGISQFFILRQSGYSVFGALLRNGLVSLSIFVGIILSLTLSSIESVEPVLIAGTTGAFLFILTRDLLPDTIATIKNTGNRKRHFIAILTGALIMIIIGFVSH